jgi:hypothetical protein
MIKLVVGVYTAVYLRLKILRVGGEYAGWMEHYKSLGLHYEITKR